jgi:hypothetical protein
VLREARTIAGRQLELAPKNPVMQNIVRHLDAMKRWSNDGRDPSERERGNIDVGLVAARELSEAAGDVAELAQKLSALNNYFEDWPTDQEAATATDDDFFEDDED